MKFILGLFLSILFVNVIAQVSHIPQVSRIAIVNEADSTLYFTHVNTVEYIIQRINCDLNPRLYVAQLLNQMLSPKYQMSEMNLPAEIAAASRGIRGSVGKDWIESLKDRFDLVIYLDSKEKGDFEHGTDAPIKSSGLYNMGPNYLVYSTITITAFYTSNATKMNYSANELANFQRVRKFPKDTDIEFQCPLIISELEKFIDYRTGYFLVRTNLVAEEDFWKIKEESL